MFCFESQINCGSTHNDVKGPFLPEVHIALAILEPQSLFCQLSREVSASALKHLDRRLVIDFSAARSVASISINGAISHIHEYEHDHGRLSKQSDSMPVDLFHKQEKVDDHKCEKHERRQEFQMLDQAESQESFWPHLYSNY